MKIPIQTISKKEIYSDQWQKISHDEIMFPNQSKGTYTYLERKNGVSTVVFTSSYEFLLINQFQYPIQDYDWNIPGGGIDANEQYEDAAVREIREETGIIVNKNNLKKIGTFFPLSSANTETVTLFYIQIPEKTEIVNHDNEEVFGAIEWFDLKKVNEMLDNNEFHDPVVCTALYYVIRKIQEK